MTQDSKLWYLCFKTRYPIWSSHVDYVCRSKKLMDWKAFTIHLIQQENSTRHCSFEFVKEETNRKRKLEEQDVENLMDDFILNKPFWIQDPLVVDIDRDSQTGMVATGKHRKNTVENRSEHKILFWEYPSWKLKRTFELNLTPPNLTCQIIGIQTIHMPSTENQHQIEPIRFFSLAIGMGMGLLHDLEDTEDRVDIWKSLFIYRLFEDGSTQCVSHIEIADSFLGREIFLFSDTSWTRKEKVSDWMKIISPSDAQSNPFTVFLLAIGPIYDRITGCVQLAKFDYRGQENILDPSILPVYWNRTLNQLVSISNHTHHDPTKIMTCIKLGQEVSCMIHFKYPTHLNHLICTGSYQEDELSVYDWRFGIKVGTLPWKSSSQQDLMDVRPWGLESTLVLPSNTQEFHDLSHRGFRLIAVGDNRSDNTRDKLEIKVWDISYLFNVDWNPSLHRGPLSKEIDLSNRFPWWSRRTSELEYYAFEMLHNHQGPLPYSPPKGFQSMLISHTFDKEDGESFIPVKYTAYNVLLTSLFLLTEDGKITVMDIETGKITGTVENVAATSLRQVRGIDVNVIAGREVVVTSREGLLRGIV